jgi:hypothetical protein
MGSAIPGFSTDSFGSRIETVEREIADVSSRQDVNKTLTISQPLTFQFTWNGANSTPVQVNVDHGLKYVPAFLAFFDTGGNKQPVPFYEVSSGSGVILSIIQAFADVDQFHLSFTPLYPTYPKPALTFSVRVFLFREPAQ